MANPFFDRPDVLGILAPPPVNTNPVQNPLDPASLEKMLQAVGADRAQKALLAKAKMRADVLRDQPGEGFAQGQGPLGIRQGVGPMGYLTSIGDAVAGIIAKKRKEAAAEGVIGQVGPVSEAEQEAAAQFVRNQPGGMFGTGYGRRPSPVSIGSPLSLSYNE